MVSGVRVAFDSRVLGPIFLFIPVSIMRAYEILIKWVAIGCLGFSCVFKGFDYNLLAYGVFVAGSNCHMSVLVLYQLLVNLYPNID
jgi:hypothetical protein